MQQTVTKPLENTRHHEWNPPEAFPHAKLIRGNLTATGQNSHRFKSFSATKEALTEGYYAAVWRYADPLVESFVTITRHSVSCAADANHTKLDPALLSPDVDTYYYVDFHHLSGTHKLRLSQPHTRARPGYDDEPSHRYQLQHNLEHATPPCFTHLKDAWEYAAFLAVESGLTPPFPISNS